MHRIDFLAHRAAFAGVPFGVLMPLLGDLRALPDGPALAAAWGRSLAAAARAARRRADAAAARGRAESASGAWLEAARAYHVASFRLHLSDRPAAQAPAVRRLRRLARACYRRALAVSSASPASSPARPFDAGGVDAYLHLPPQSPAGLEGGRARGVVVLLNGLDSLCEVEMHAFAQPALERGLAALAVDLPGDFGRRLEVCDPEPAPERWRMEAWTGRIAAALDREPATAALPIGAFGVSFGGHLAARCLAGDAPFAAAVAVSPGAWLGEEQLAMERVEAMARLALDPAGRLDAGLDLGRLGRLMDLRLLPPTERPLRLEVMSRDALFGPEHVDACRAFAPAAEVHEHDAEHVGTSLIHRWLPAAFDWLAERLSAQRPSTPSIATVQGDSNLVAV